jgi:outer membrane biosynthesis protein TonB
MHSKTAEGGASMRLFFPVGIIVAAAIAFAAPGGAASPEPSPSPAAASPSAAPTCPQPNRPARTNHVPETARPPGTAGIIGLVEVLVSLDERGAVTATAIRSSPGEVLNASAIAAARATTYFPALQDCVPVPSKYVFAVYYS